MRGTDYPLDLRRQTVRLLQDRARLYATFNPAASIIAGLGAAGIGAAFVQATLG